MESQETPNHQNNTEEEQVGDLTLPDFKIYLQTDQSNQYSAIMAYRQTYRPMEEHREPRNTHMCSNDF